MGYQILRSNDFSSSWTVLAEVDYTASSYTDTTVDPTEAYVYKVIGVSNVNKTASVSNEKHLPWQYYTGSITSTALKYIDSKVLNTSGIEIYTSASYTASFVGTMSGWIAGIPSQSIDEYFVRYNVVTDVQYVVATSSLLTLILNNSQSYDASYSNSFVGSVTSSLSGSRNMYYIQGAILTDTYYNTNNTTSLCYADIKFSSSYDYTFTGSVSGSVYNLQSGSYSDYWMYLYRYVEGDQLYVFPAPGSCSIDANGQFTDDSFNSGHIIAKMYPKGVTDLSKPAAIAGYAEHGKFFNAGVNGYYISSTGSGIDTNGFIGDLGRIQGYTGTKVGRIARQSDGRVLGSSDNPLPYTASWTFVDASTNPKSFRLATNDTTVVLGGYDTASFIVETGASIGLLNSYWTPAGEILNRRCFTYDQGVAIIAMVNENLPGRAADLVSGALLALTGSKSGSFALSGSQWAFSVNAMNGIYVDPYYRNGAQFWVAEGLSFFAEKYPTSSLVPSITQSLKNFWTTMFDYYWCGPSGSGLLPITASAAEYVALDAGDTGYVEDTGSYSGSGLLLNTFLGGAGVYHIPDYIFTASYVIPWASCEHNTDAFFALRSSARAIGGAWSSSLAASASLLGNSLRNTFWYASGSQLRQKNANSQSRAYQGLSNPYKPDDAHALDVSSWYGMALLALGEYGKFSASMAVLPQYYLTDPGGSGATGYTPYLEAYEYAGTTPTVWIEGTSGVIMAYRAAGSHSYAHNIYKSLVPLFSASFGFPYASVPDPTYEIGSSGSATANTWMLLAKNPNGFWEVDF